MGSLPCQPGCVCRKHSPRVAAIDWSDPEARRVYGREAARVRREADREPSREAARKWAAKNPGYRLAYKFGLTLEQWEQMFAAQDGLCYLCAEPLRSDRIGSRGSWIHVDHDRSCCRGERSCGICIRGLACHPCNTGVGHFGDDPERMRRVADNLEMANRRLRQSAPRGLSASSNALAGEEIV